MNKRLGAVSLLSSASDSLLYEVKSLLPYQQVEILLNVSSNDETTSLGTEKQEHLLLKALTFASKKDQKKILQRLIILYQKLDQWGISNAISKGIKRCEELETQYSLSREEFRNLKRIKANLLNRQGSYKESISILYELLEEDRIANEVEYVIEELYTIAVYFIRLGDLETALLILKEIYFKAAAEGLKEQQYICLSSIIDASFNLKRYSDIDSISNNINLDSLSHFTSSSIYLMLAKSNLHLQKTDRARFYLLQMNQKSQKGTGMVFYCQMAETYIAENREDSATFYLNEALKAKGIFDKTDRSIENLPLYFMYVYPSYASLLQRNGKLQQAQDAFQFVEPLMKTPVSESERIEKQIDALGRYSDFCRLTRQYAKATELLVYRDSIQKMYYENKISLDSKHWVDRFEIQELTNKNAKQADEINNAKRILSILIVVSVIILILCAIIVYLYRLTRKQYKKSFENKQQEILGGTVDLSPQLVPEPSKKREPLTPQERYFRKACKMVESQKLYLNNALTLEILSEMVGTNRSTLSACINQYAKVNFNRWINDYRIDHVKRCITPATNFSEIYKEFGFNSYNTFNNSFKKRVGCTPNEYLQKLTADEFQDTDTMV
ncbi:AraC family transcriptional regulator [Bacteroides sp.]|uniref:helix-turn-helix domain-containing protein n=1 Tax=Bacteroides sp. TaxID=29523 RepID=UPI00260DE728|nr:AraC family transcriptional regulator [Bacteroides sp.]